MRKILCLLAFSALIAFAQEDYFRSYRLTAGLSLSSMNFDLGGDTEKTDNLMDFHVNFISDIPLASFLAFQSGIIFASKGGELKRDELSVIDKETYSLYYLQTPIMLSLRFPINEIVVLRTSAGLYIASGLFGTIKIDSKNNAGSEKEDAFGNYFNYFDAGLSFGGGVEFYRFYAGIIYDNGMANILNTSNSKYRATNSTLGFTLGYIF